MTLRIRHCCIAALILYWPFIFFLAHVPQVPIWILRTQMTDKTLHYLGYLVLVFLWWFSIFPSQKPSIRLWPLWFTLAMMAVYGGLDEWLQGFAHRTPDVWDWTADMLGVLTGLVIFGVVGLRLSAFSITAVCIFALTSLCKADPLGFVPFIDILFYIGAYSLVTLLWMGYLKKQPDLSRLSYVLLSLLVPVLLLIITSVVASSMRKHFATDRVIAAVGGIVAAVIIAFVVHLCRPASKPVILS